MKTVARADALREIESEVGVLARRIRRVVRDRAVAVHPDLQPASYLMLAHIAARGPVRASAMCTAFAIDKGAMSRHAQHLIDLGLVDRQPDPEDGRATLLSITESGRQRMDTVAETRRSALDERLADWSGEELEQFAAMLRRYNDALGLPIDR